MSWYFIDSEIQQNQDKLFITSKYVVFLWMMTVQPWFNSLISNAPGPPSFFTKFILRFWDIMFWLSSRHIHCCFFANLVFLFRVSNKLDMHIEITHNFPICYESHLPCNNHRHLLLLLLLPTYNIEQLKVTSLANFSFAKFH